MNGKISKEGTLYIERAGVMKLQFCPHNPYALGSDNGMTECGDWCPLFGEPVFDKIHEISVDGTYKNIEVKERDNISAILSLCKHELRFERLTDERGKN